MIDSRAVQGGVKVAFGCLLLMLGVGIAIAAIPENYSERGALTLSGFILVAAMILPTLPNFKPDADRLMRGENVLIGALIYWTLLDVLQGAYSLPVSRDAIVREYLLLGVTAMGFWIGANAGTPLAPRFLTREATQPWSPVMLVRILVIAFMLGIWDFFYSSGFDVVTIINALQSNRWETPWQREALGDWSAFSYHLQYFGYLVPALTVMVALRLGWRHPATLMGLMMTGTILTFHAQGGGRRIVGSMILAGLFCWIIHVRRLSGRRAVMVVGVVIGLLALLQLMLIYRNVGFGDEASGLSQYDYMHVDDNFLRIAQMLEFVPDTMPFVGFQYVLFALVRPIPRVLWPGKPVDGGFDLAELLGIPDTSFALTSAGELYVSYGYVAVFVGALVYGRISSMVNGLFEHDARTLNPMFPSLLLVWLFVGVRSMLEVMLMGYVVLAILFLSKLGRFIENLASAQARARGEAKR